MTECRILVGDCRERLRELPDGSVHCVVTSPPYFGLRDYGTAKWEGGNGACDHVERIPSRGSSTLTSAGIGQTDDGAAYLAQKRQFLHKCLKCGGRRIDSQIGLEPTPDAYVAEMVAVFREVRRVLRGDGTLWLNLGDSYAAQRGGTAMPAETLAGGVNGKGGNAAHRGHGSTHAHRNAGRLGLKHKDLIGIPWRVAFALQADGWWLRQDIIWSKPNPMPESVTDRCTKAHEYLFLLSKSERYFYDADAIREPQSDAFLQRAERTWNPSSRNGDAKPPSDSARWRVQELRPHEIGRNKRSVWTVTTEAYADAHFATFPPALIEPCIKAGCPAGGTVLDPFAGAGTDWLVADRLGRSSILIELNPGYAAMAERRIRGDLPLFTQVESIAVADGAQGEMFR